MAVMIDKQYNTGVVAKYHRILSSKIDFQSNLIEIEIASYVSEETRRGGFDPVERKKVFFPMQGAVDIRDTLYSMISQELPPTEIDENGHPMMPLITPSGFNGGEMV